MFNKGVVPNKSLILQPYPVPEEFQHHYWRGFIDGDGSVYTRIIPKNVESFGLQLVGSLDVIKSFEKWCLQYTELKSQVHPNGNVFYLVINKRESVLALLTQLYNNATVFLDRKQATANEILERLPFLIKRA